MKLSLVNGMLNDKYLPFSEIKVTEQVSNYYFKFNSKGKVFLTGITLVHHLDVAVII